MLDQRKLDGLANADAFLANAKLPTYTELVALLVHLRRLRCAPVTAEYEAEVQAKLLDVLRRTHSRAELEALANAGLM